MKSLFLTSLCVLSFRICAQIPNAGFEDWQQNQACLKPLIWNTVYSLFDSSGTYCPVQRSEDHYPEDLGQYSVRIANDTAIWHSGTGPAAWLGWGIMFSARENDRPLFPVQGRPKSFCGYYRFLPENGDTLNFRAFLYQNGTEITMAHFRTSIPAPQWTAFQVYFSDTTYASADSGRITLSSANEPKDGSLGPLGNSVVWVDNISFDRLLTGNKPVLEKTPLNICLLREQGELLLERNQDACSRDAIIILSDVQGKKIKELSWMANESRLSLNIPGHNGIMLLQYHDGRYRQSKILTTEK